MTASEEIEYYQGYLEKMLYTLCSATGMEAERYDRDQADGECFADCFKDIAKALEKFEIRFDSETGDFIQNTSQWIKIESAEDVEIKGEEVLLWDGCDHHIDYVEYCSDTGVHYFANGTEATHWKLLDKPVTQE